MSQSFYEFSYPDAALEFEWVPMTPPIQRARMLPEPIEFPVHDFFRRLFRRFGFR